MVGGGGGGGAELNQRMGCKKRSTFLSFDVRFLPC